jgi:predicted 2-oxoglutarate/Fe(II)-dependent dioxygenase YbiX
MIYYNDIIFTKEKCDDILMSANDFQKSGLQKQVDTVDYGWTYNPKKRKSTQCLMSAPKGTQLFEKINNVLNGFGYEICIDEFKYDVIKYQEGDFIWRHKDDGGKRIFSLVLQLNNSEDYEGGDFKYWVDENEMTLPRVKGHGIIFKSSVFHEVTPVIDGERHSLVSFLNFGEIKQLAGPALI